MNTALCSFIFILVVSVNAESIHFQRVCRHEEYGADKLQLRYDENSATIDFSLLDSERQNHFTSYKVHLFADWSRLIEDGNSADCDAHLLFHSTYDITVGDELPIRMKYVYSGFYRMDVVPWINDTVSFKSFSVKFIARTFLRPVPVQNWTTQFIIHPLPRFSSIIIQFIPASIDYDFLWYEVLLSNCDDDSLPLSVGHPQICHANYSRPECTFKPLVSGKYCAFIRPLDQRCKELNVWQVKDHCIVHSDVIKLDEPTFSTHAEWLTNTSALSRANFSATILSSVIISVILIVTILGALIYRNIKRKSILMGNHRKFSTSRLITIPTMNVHKTHKKILLLWIRDNLDLTQRVDQLKSQLAKHCNAEVIDIYDDDVYDDLSVDPILWLNQTMADHNLRYVIVGSFKLERYLSFLEPIEENLDCLEGLVLYAVKELRLRRVASQSLYSTTFYVRFKSVSCCQEETNELTPFCRFLLPTHCAELFMYINN